jgi:AAA domain/DnaB-like helicase N terminal domain
VPVFQKNYEQTELANDPDLERALLGAALLSEQALVELLSARNSEDFSDLRHQNLMHCYRSLAAQGVTVDLTSVGRDLYARGWQDDVGMQYLGSLTDGVVPEHIGDYLRQFKRPAEARFFVNEVQKAVRAIGDGFSGEHPVEAMRTIVERFQNRLVEVTADTRHLLTLEELEEMPPPEPFGHTGLIQHSFNVWVGLPGTYKTFLAILKVAQLSRLGYRIVYITAEGRAGIPSRIRAEMERNGAKLENILFWPKAVRLMSEAAVDDFCALVKRSWPTVDLVVFDTYIRCSIGGDLGTGPDTTTMTENIKRIQGSLSSAILLVHHTTKTGASYYGSVFLEANSDVFWVFTLEEGIVTVENTRNKDGASMPTEHYSFLEMGDSGVLIPAHQAKKSTELTPNGRKVLECLALESFRQSGAKTNQIAQATGIPLGTLYRVLSTLKLNSHVSQSEKGDPWWILTGGLAALSRGFSLDASTSSGPNGRDLRGEFSDSQPILTESSPPDSTRFSHSHPPSTEGDVRNENERKRKRRESGGVEI